MRSSGENREFTELKGRSWQIDLAQRTKLLGMRTTVPTKEAAMPRTQVPQEDNYPTVNFVLDTIAGWVNKYRAAADARDALGLCNAEDVRQIANDLGLSVGELQAMSASNPHSADLLVKMLTALSVDPDFLARSDPATMRDLQRLCMSCGHKRRCAYELAAGTATKHYQSFCPNAFTLDALLKAKERAAH
jgi:hypothetical protein